MPLMLTTLNQPIQPLVKNKQTGSREKSLKDKELELLLEAFKKKHPNIEEALGSDKGVELMHMDGRITAKVIKHFTNKNIPILKHP